MVFNCSKKHAVKINAITIADCYCTLLSDDLLTLPAVNMFNVKHVEKGIVYTF